MCFYQLLRSHRQYRSTKAAASHFYLPANLYNIEKAVEVAAAVSTKSWYVATGLYGIMSKEIIVFIRK